MSVSRKFLDSEGVTWQVYELEPLASRDAVREAGWLYFFSRGVTRVLSAYPDDWRQMDWPGLERLCVRAGPPGESPHPDRPAMTSGAGITT